MASIDELDLERARRLYSDGLGTAEIAAQLGRTERTIRRWARQHEWKRYSSPAARLEAAIAEILDKAEQSEDDLRRLDRYSRNLAKLLKGEGRQRERRPPRRDKGPLLPHWFAYQQAFLDDRSLFRMARKSRQIGFTRTIAWEGLEDAMRRGRDKGYVSASFRQTGQILRAVKQFGREYFGLKLRGTEVVRLPNEAEMHFLAANPATVQGFTGDIYFDEFAWTLRAREIFENAAAIATLGDYRITITSTPSVKTHFFEELWNPSRNDLEVSRHEVTLIDAVEGGNNLIDLGKILKLFRPEAVRRLFMCETLDDAGAAFTFDEVMACVHDDDAALFERKPGEEVWGGMDVSRWRDDTSIIFLAVDRRHDKPVFTWRNRTTMHRVALPVQSARVTGLLAEWEPEEFTIDHTTIGEHIADEILEVMPRATLVRFSGATKAMLVINAQDIVRGRRLRIPFDQRLIDSFLAIKRKYLETNVGFEAEGGEEIGHADDFWALALAAYPAWGSGSDTGVMII